MGKNVAHYKSCSFSFGSNQFHRNNYPLVFRNSKLIRLYPSTQGGKKPVYRILIFYFYIMSCHPNPSSTYSTSYWFLKIKRKKIAAIFRSLLYFFLPRSPCVCSLFFCWISLYRVQHLQLLLITAESIIINAEMFSILFVVTVRLFPNKKRRWTPAALPKVTCKVILLLLLRQYKLTDISGRRKDWKKKKLSDDVILYSP
jgi:hypothetical protein